MNRWLRGLVLALLSSLACASTSVAQNAQDVAALNAEVARLYRAGKYDEALPLAQQVLALREKLQEPRDVVESLNNVAELNRALGRYSIAEQFFKRSLAVIEKSLAPGDPFVGASLSNLAGLYREQGRFGEAEQLVKRTLMLAETNLGADHPDIAEPLGYLAVLYLAQGRFGEAEPLFKRSLALREKALGPDHPDVAASLNYLAGLYHTQGRFGDAEPLFKRSLALVEKALGTAHPHFAASLNNLAELYRDQGRFGEAEPLHRRSLALFEKALGTDHPHVANSLNNLALLYRVLGRFDEAESHFKRSLALREKALGGDHPDVATSLNNLAELYLAQGRFGEAEPLFKRSLALREKALGPDHADVATSLNNLAWLALARNDLTGAADRWRHATIVLQRRAERKLGGVAGGSSKGEAQRRSWFFEGLVKTTHRLVSEGREAQAQRAARMFETAQWGASSEAAAALAQMAARSAGGSPALSALVREHQDLVVEWQAKDKALIAFKSEPLQMRKAEAEQALGDRLAAIDWRLGEIDATLAKDFPDYAGLASPKPVSLVDVQAALGDNEALLLFLDTSDRFKPLPEETFVWAVTKADVRWVRSDLGTAALRREVAALRCGLDATNWTNPSQWQEVTPEERRRKAEQAQRLKLCTDLTGVFHDGSAGKVLPFDAARAHALYKDLLGEAADIIKGKHLLVVPSGALTTLPFQVLVTARPAPRTTWKSVRWLARDHAITVLPSVAALKSLRRVGRPSTAPKPMIGFANPLLDGYQADRAHGTYFRSMAQKARGQTACATQAARRTASLRRVTRSAMPVPTISGLADLRHLRMQTPLPETADEVCAVARSIGADVREMRIGATATETEIKRLSASGDLARYRIVHFATHGLLAGQLTGTREPGLILTPPKTATAEDDGYLSGSEIAELKLDADWVILSACNTAGGAGQGEAAEALSGLARVFFYGGARAMLVSHWEVDSDAAVKLVTAAIGELAKDKGIGRGEALRRAMLAVMDDTSRPRNWVPAVHPSVWAPFVVVGEGGAGR